MENIAKYSSLVTALADVELHYIDNRLEGLSIEEDHIESDIDVRNVDLSYGKFLQEMHECYHKLHKPAQLVLQEYFGTREFPKEHGRLVTPDVPRAVPFHPVDVPFAS